MIAVFIYSEESYAEL